MARRKVVFVIVEGPSDDEALGVMLNRIFNKDLVYVHVMHCDITSMRGVSTQNIEARVTEVVKEFAASSRLKPNDFREIIHISDTDGTYIPDENVVEDKSLNKVHYSTTQITTANRNGIVDRNRQKQANMDKLSECDTMWKTIPYSLYYMSCNLDHVLHDKLNCDRREKEKNSLRFARMFKNDIVAFVEFITYSDFSVSDDYVASWEFIRKDLHSLQRHTNLGVCLKRQMGWN